MEQIVKVVYYKKELNGFAGRKYTYKTNMNLEEFDIVVAPTENDSDQKALVVEVNLPDETIQKEWSDRVKYITEYAEIEEEAGETE